MLLSNLLKPVIILARKEGFNCVRHPTSDIPYPTPDTLPTPQVTCQPFRSRG